MSRPIEITFAAATADAEAGAARLADAIDEVAASTVSLTDDEVRATDEYRAQLDERRRAVNAEFDDRVRAQADTLGQMSRAEFAHTDEGERLAADRGRAHARAQDDALQATRESLAAQAAAAETTADDMTAAVDDYADTATDAHDRAARSAEDAGDRATRATRDMADDVQDASREIGDVIKGGFEDGAAGAGAAVADIVQDLPGMGLAAVGAGAIVKAGFDLMSDSAERAEERVRAVTEAMIEAGSREVEESFIQRMLHDIYTEADGAVIKLSDLRDAVDQTGISEAQWARAMAGDQAERLSILDQLRTAYAQTEDDIVSLDQATVDSATKTQAELDRWITKLEDLTGEYDTAAARAEGYADAVRLGQERATEATTGTISEYERLAQTLEGLPASPVISPTIDLTEAEAELRRWRPTVPITPRLGQAVV